MIVPVMIADHVMNADFQDDAFLRCKIRLPASIRRRQDDRLTVCDALQYFKRLLVLSNNGSRGFLQFGRKIRAADVTPWTGVVECTGRGIQPKGGVKRVEDVPH